MFLVRFSDYLHRIYLMSLKLRILLILKSLLLDLHLEIGGRLKTKLYDKRDDFTFPTVNIPFISISISASPAYSVYISQLKRYSRACAQYRDFMERAQPLTQKLIKQGYVAPRLKSSLQKFYSHHHNLVDHYEKYPYLKKQWIFYFLRRCFLSSITTKTCTGIDCIYE